MRVETASGFIGGRVRQCEHRQTRCWISNQDGDNHSAVDKFSSSDELDVDKQS